MRLYEENSMEEQDKDIIDDLRPFGDDHLSNGLHQALTQDPRLRDVSAEMKRRYIRAVRDGKPPLKMKQKK